MKGQIPYIIDKEKPVEAGFLLECKKRVEDYRNSSENLENDQIRNIDNLYTITKPEDSQRIIQRYERILNHIEENQEKQLEALKVKFRDGTSVSYYKQLAAIYEEKFIRRGSVQDSEERDLISLNKIDGMLYRNKDGSMSKVDTVNL